MTDKPKDNKPDTGADNGKNASPLAALDRGKWALKKLGYRAFRLSGELTSITLGLGFLWCYSMSSLLAKKTLDVTALEPNIAMWFSDAFDGRSAEIGAMTLNWNPSSNSLIFDISEINVKDKYRVRQNNIKNIQTTFDFGEAIRGRVKVNHVSLDGGVVTWKRASNGDVITGVGTPETVGQFTTLPSGENNAQEADAPRRPFTIGRLGGVTVTNSTVYVVDAVNGIDLQFEQADLNISREESKFLLTASANMNHQSEASDFSAKASFSGDFEDFDLAFSAENFNPAWFAPKVGRLSQVNKLDAPIDINLHIMSERELGLTQADLDFNVGAGLLLLSKEALPVEQFKLKAGYDPVTEILEFTGIDLKSAKYVFSGSGQMTNIGRPAIGFFRQPAGFKADILDAQIDASDIFDGPFNMKRITVAGGFDLGNNSLILNNLEVAFPDFLLQTRLEIERDSAGDLELISGNGQVTGDMTAQQLLELWPSKFADGARRWIARSIKTGIIDELKFEFAVPKTGLSGQPLNDDDLALNFHVREGTVQYISTMTPYTKASGYGLLRGNSFQFDAETGTVGELVINSAKVEIPRLNPKGGDLIIDVKGAGGISDMLALIDQKPFGFASLYGIDPGKFSGTGNAALRISRPLLEHFDRSEIEYSVEGEFTDVKVPYSLGLYQLENGNFTLSGDKNGIKATGPVELGPWKTRLEWDQPFSENPGPTTYRLFGPMDRETLNGFGIGLRKYFGGQFFVEIDAAGQGLSIADAKLIADLTEAELKIGEYWSKESGVAANISGLLRRSEAGVFSANDVKMSAPGLAVDGHVEFAEDMRLLGFELARAEIDGLIDGALTVAPSTDLSAFDVALNGAFLDVSPLVAQSLASPSKSGIAFPLNLTAKLDRLGLSEGFILSNASLEVVHNGVGTERGLIKGTTSKGAFDAQIFQKDGESRRTLMVDIPDASRAMSSFLNVNSVKGGRLRLDAQIPEVGAEGPVQGTLKVDDFVLVNAPVFAQMLSLASLKGLADAMGGAGLNFSELEIPFAYRQGLLSVREGRASGPALGLTGSGDVDIGKRIVDVDGVLVPAYTTNSALASIPVIGDIFVGKKGEGIFALSYSVKGPFKSTQVAVNPLSALTPGFLRRIFESQRDALPEMDIDAEPEKDADEPPKTDGP